MAATGNDSAHGERDPTPRPPQPETPLTTGKAKAPPQGPAPPTARPRVTTPGPRVTTPGPRVTTPGPRNWRDHAFPPQDHALPPQDPETGATMRKLARPRVTTPGPRNRRAKATAPTQATKGATRPARGTSSVPPTTKQTRRGEAPGGRERSKDEPKPLATEPREEKGPEQESLRRGKCKCGRVGR